MAKRRALLIGAADYDGEDFVRLPAVHNDIRLMSGALESCGYEIEILPEEIARSANQTGNAMEDFCSRCEIDDTHIIYFSGHGMILDNRDCLIPAGAKLRSVLARADQRIPTDLTQWFGSRKHGLVLFIIDACRTSEHARTAKSAGGGWGEGGLSVPSESFIRLFGCSAGQVCQVLEQGCGGKPISLFTKALSDVLAEGETPTLKEILKKVQTHCGELAEAGLLQSQTPRLNRGEESADSVQLLDAPIFSAAAQVGTGASLWDEFDPAKFHCLVISSERETQATGSSSLADLALPAIASHAPKLWEAFREKQNGLPLVSGKRRELGQVFEAKRVRTAALSINDVLASQAALEQAVRGLIEADLAVIDVTGFEPGVMLLLGVRAACRRGVTLCSHGNGWREGQPLELPFNLSDLSIGSHTPRDPSTGPDPVEARFIDRVLSGFHQLARQPRYLDLPAFDALRQLGPEPAASSIVGIKSQVLMLCPYEKAFFGRWDFVSKKLTNRLAEPPYELRPEKIVRVIDLGSPQLVSQSIYEQIRRTAACVADWSGYSPSVFLELGIRLAVSAWGAVSIVDDQFGEESEDSLAKYRAGLRQTRQLRKLLQPVQYSGRGNREDFDKVAGKLATSDANRDAPEDLSPVHAVAWRAISQVQPAWPAVFDELSSAADSLSQSSGKRPEPRILFSESDALKEYSGQAALERRIAAWLYLDRRVGLEKLLRASSAAEAYRKLGQDAAGALYERGEADDLELAGYIEKQIQTLNRRQN